MGPNEGTLYLAAFRLACELAEGRGVDTQRDLNRWADDGGLGESILAEVLQRIAPGDVRGRELVAAAVGDAIEGRRPQW